AAGYAAEPWPGFLFAWAQSERRRDHCSVAIALYRRFLATEQPAGARQLATDGIAACGGRGDVEPVPPPIEPPVPPHGLPNPPSAPPTPAGPAPPREAPGFRHKLAAGLVGGGLVAGGTALTFYLLARRDAADADRALTHPEASALYDRGETRLLI